MTELPKFLLQNVFDIAVHSMDFGSGFLDDEDVDALRSVAAILGVDQMEGTPENFRCKYRGYHAAYPFLDRYIFDSYADGFPRNAYAYKLRDAAGNAPMIRGYVIRMRCPDCGRRWDAFEKPAPIEPLEKGRL